MPKSKRRRRRGGPVPKAKIYAAEAFNKLLQRTRPQGEKIPADYEQIEPDRGERL